MLTKLLSLLSTAKGAAAAAVVVAAAGTTGVVATNPDVQQSLQQTVQQVTGAKPSDCPARASASGQPAVVAARNAADQKLRDAFQDEQTALEKLRATKVDSTDRAKLDDLLKDADAKLRARLTKALDDVAKLTLGRAGLVDQAGSSAKSSEVPCERGAYVAFSSADGTKVDGLVTPAIADLQKIVADATTAASALPTFTPGKPSDASGSAPSERPTPPATPARPTPTPTR